MIPLIKRDLIRDEGWVPHAYKDSEGYLTIGVGHLIDKRKKGELPAKIIDALLMHDIREVMKQLDKKLPWWRSLDETRQRVLVNMAFNLGINGLLKFRKMLAALEAGDYEKAAEEMLDSRWAKQVGKRAERLWAMMMTG